MNSMLRSLRGYHLPFLRTGTAPTSLRTQQKALESQPVFHYRSKNRLADTCKPSMIRNAIPSRPASSQQSGQSQQITAVLPEWIK